MAYQCSYNVRRGVKPVLSTRESKEQVEVPRLWEASDGGLQLGPQRRVRVDLRIIQEGEE